MFQLTVKGSKNNEHEEPKFYQKFQTINEQVTVSEVYEDFQQHFEGVAATVDLKACVCYFLSNFYLFFHQMIGLQKL